MQAMWEDPRNFSPFKFGIVIPVPKSSGGYRPITLLSQLGKVLERIISRRLSALINTPNAGCRAHAGRNHCLLRLSHLATQHETAIVVFYDFTKAYDSVDHHILITKLKRIPNIDPHLVTWIAHFLKDRSFVVRMDNLISVYVAFPSTGLPQGSPLSVPLWHVFVIDLPLEEDDNSYMDDWAAAIVAQSWTDAEYQAQLRINKAAQWAKDNFMEFDRRKTKVLCLHSDIAVSLFLNGEELEQVQSYNYLGCVLSSRSEIDFPNSGFSTTAQVNLNIQRTRQKMVFLPTLAHSPQVALVYFKSILRSTLTNNLLILGKEVHAIQRLQTCQNICLRKTLKALPSTPAFDLHIISDTPCIISSIESQARRFYGALMAYPSTCGSDYQRWISRDEGWNNEHSPFGWVQYASLIPQEFTGLQFSEYSRCETAQCRASYSLKSTQNMPQFTPELIIFTDGSYQGESHKGATGWCILSRHGLLLHQGSQTYFPMFSALQAEKQAIQDSLEAASQMAEFAQATQILIQTDSQALVNNIGDLAYSRERRISPTDYDLLEICDLEQGSIRIEKCQGHSNLFGNTLADNLARKAVQSDNLPLPLDLDLTYFYKKHDKDRHPKPEFLSPSSQFSRLQCQARQFKRFWKSCSHFIPLLTRILSNHTRLRFSWCHSEEKQLTFQQCPHCLQEPVEPRHFIEECSAIYVTNLKHEWFPGPQVYLHLLQNPKNWMPLCCFFDKLSISI
jgi:ribonuclease HI